MRAPLTALQPQARLYLLHQSKYGSFITADLSDASGDYSLTALNPTFDYRITVEAFPGDPPLVLAKQNVGNNDAIDSDVDASGLSAQLLDGYDLVNDTVWAGVFAAGIDPKETTSAR